MNQGAVSVGPAFAVVLAALVVLAVAAALIGRLGVSRAVVTASARAVTVELVAGGLLRRPRRAGGLRVEPPAPRPLAAGGPMSRPHLLFVLLLFVSGCTPAAEKKATTGYTKVLMIAEENHGYDQIIGSPDALYLNELAGTYGTATHFDAGYPPRCPSLAAYILLTSGTDAGICDDRAPKAHPLRGDNLFRQVSAGGREWRDYAESAPGPCTLDNGKDGRYLVRHVPATYYIDDRTARPCAQSRKC